MVTRGVFITGTDTGVGKTMVGGILAAGLRARGVDVGVMKPLESGCCRQNGRLQPQDALLLKEMAGVDDDIDLICPYCFEQPLAPGIAAEREGVEIDLARIVRAYEELKRLHEVIIVEGAGGVLVPVTAGLLAPDLMRVFGLPLLVVARARLGTINHTLLTINEARRLSLEVMGVVLNQDDPVPDPASESNAQILERFLTVPIIGKVPYFGTMLSPEEAAKVGILALHCLTDIEPAYQHQ